LGGKEVEVSFTLCVEPEKGVRSGDIDPKAHVPGSLKRGHGVDPAVMTNDAYDSGCTSLVHSAGVKEEGGRKRVGPVVLPGGERVRGRNRRIKRQVPQDRKRAE